MPLSPTVGQNRFMQGDPQGGPPEPEPQAQAGGMGAAPPGGPPAPPAAPAAPPSPPTPEQLKMAKLHLDEQFKALKGLISLPHLTKKDVFSAVSDMIAGGAFPTVGAKQELISEMAKLPDDEPGLRKVIGLRAMQVSEMLQKLQTVGGGQHAGA